MSTTTDPIIATADSIRWDLSELFSGIEDSQIKKTLEQGKQEAEAFVARYKGKLTSLSDQELAQAYRTLEDIWTPLYKVSQYVHLMYATDTADDTIKSTVAFVDEAESEIGNLMVFFSLELGEVSETIFKTWQTPALANYAYSLLRTKETARYNLSEKEEQLVNIKDLTGSRAFRKLYSELTSSFQFEFEIDGQLKKMNGSELRALRQHPDKDIRRKAMALFFSRYEETQLTLTHCFNNIVKNEALENQLRGYTTPISPRNIGNDLSEEVVAVLHQITSESYVLVQRYYKLKAKLLNLPDMTLADIYAPMPKSSKKYSWEETKTLVLNSFKAFDEEIYAMAKAMFDENRIDAPVTPTKRGGAFCSSSTPDLKPYVLLNFLGRQRDVSTLAHELGHAIHDMLCSKQTLTNYHPILPLAETASVFAEMLLTDQFLKQETDLLAKQALLTDKLEDIFATSHRQNMFSRFEMASHAKIGENLMSSQELCDLYESELKAMFGDAVIYTPEYRWEWTSIPHIYESPFYVYAYNFGNLLVMALYQQYLEEGKSFIPKYKEFLSLGSAASPIDITQTVKADIQSPEFWRKSLRYIERLVEELEQISAKLSA